jgi:6-phosphogluconolactonase
VTSKLSDELCISTIRTLYIFTHDSIGVGEDGPTHQPIEQLASLRAIPGLITLQERTRLVVANWVEKFKAYRVTLTVPALSRAPRVVFLVSGEEKAKVLRAVLQDAGSRARFPASLIRPADGRLTWLVDPSAARLLPRPLGRDRSGREH